MIYLMYGQPGTGKSTLATSIVLQYAVEGRKIATNYHIDLAPASSKPDAVFAKAFCTVIPDRPSFEQLNSIGFGWHPDETGREDRAGLLVIDEAGPWLNSRTWNDKERGKIIDWFLQSRKRGWDIIFIAQAPALLDKQVREAVIEGYARCRRTDRVKKMGFRLPRVHVAIARYGLDQNAPMLERWVYRGGEVHKCFNSHSLFDEKTAPEGAYCTLPPLLSKWRYVAPQITLRQRIAAYLSGQVARAKPSPKPKLPLVDALSRLPPDQAVKHWHRLNALGAFSAG